MGIPLGIINPKFEKLECLRSYLKNDCLGDVSEGESQVQKHKIVDYSLPVILSAALVRDGLRCNLVGPHNLSAEIPPQAASNRRSSWLTGHEPVASPTKGT